MGAILAVGDDHVWMSTGSAEALRWGLIAYLRAHGHDRSTPGVRAIEAIELMWPADLSDEGPPWDEPEMRALLAPAWLALARDVAQAEPRLVPEVEWAQLSRDWRIRWIAKLLRVSRAWSGGDLTDELSAGWPAHERAALDLELAESAISRSFRCLCATRHHADRRTLEEALEAQRRVALERLPERVASLDEGHARIRARADEEARIGRG